MTLTDDEADRRLLALANEKGKFGLEVGPTEPWVQLALERGFDEDWFRLVDVTPTADYPDRLLRIFKLTPQGWHRKSRLTRGRPW